MSEQAVAIPEMVGALPPRPVADIATLKRIKQQWEEYLRSELKSGVDYRAYDEGGKDGLTKAGAENLIKTAGFAVDDGDFLEKIEHWEDPAFFSYVFKVYVRDSQGRTRGFGIGEANSHEKKWRWRWVPKERVPKALDLGTLDTRDTSLREFAFAVEKAQTTGQWGKPAEHWQAFKDAIGAGTAKKIKMKTKKGEERDAWEIGGTLYRVPNDDVASLRNTILKMCKKRAMVDAALTATGMSDRFTQYDEDEDTGSNGEPADTGTEKQVKVESPAAQAETSTVEPPVKDGSRGDSPSPAGDAPQMDAIAVACAEWLEDIGKAESVEKLAAIWKTLQAKNVWPNFNAEQQEAMKAAKDKRKTALAEAPAQGNLV